MALKEIETDIHLETFLNGEEVINHLEENPSNLPDMIITDLNMPKVNGLEVIDFIKTNPLFSPIPVVLLTTTSCPESQNKALELGAESVHTKGDTFKEVIEIINTIIQRLNLLKVM